MSRHPEGWESCPSDLLLTILLHLPLRDRLQAARVCSQWRNQFCTAQPQQSEGNSKLIGELCLDVPATAFCLAQNQHPGEEGIHLGRWLAQRAWAIPMLHVKVVPPTKTLHIGKCGQGCITCSAGAELLTSMVHSLQRELAAGSLCMDLVLEAYAGAANEIFSEHFFRANFLISLAPHLTGLTINVEDAHASRGHFADMCRLTRLTSLCYIRTTKKTADPGLFTSAITALRGLQRLKFVQDACSAGWWKSTLPPELSELPHLSEVTYEGTGDCMPVVARISGLQRLRLDFCPVEFPASLAPMTALRELYIGNDVSEFALVSPYDAISSMHSLTRLELSGCEFPEGDESQLLQAIQHLTNLEAISGLCLDMRTSFPRLQSLSQHWWEEVHLDAVRLSSLSCVSALTSLSLQGYLELGESWRGLCEVLPHLRSLELTTWREGWSDESKMQLQALQGLTARTNLALESFKYSDMS